MVQDFARRYTAAWCSQNAASVAAFFLAGRLPDHQRGSLGGANRYHPGSPGFHDGIPRYGGYDRGYFLCGRPVYLQVEAYGHQYRISGQDSQSQHQWFRGMVVWFG